MLSRLIREFLFSVTHWILTIVEIIQFVHNFSWKYLVSFRGYYRNASDIQLIAANITDITKKPKHLVLIADGRYFSLSDLANVIIWSLFAGIPFVSFYDEKGTHNHEEDKLFLEVERRKRGIPGCIKWSLRPDLNGYSNGSKPHVTVVNTFTNNDGRPKFAEIIRAVAEQRIHCDRAGDEYTSEELDAAAASCYPAVPDPDVIVYGGPVCCPGGLPPWHLRLSEFIQIQTYSERVQVQQFLGVLRKYSRSDQRFGK